MEGRKRKKLSLKSNKPTSKAGRVVASKNELKCVPESETEFDTEIPVVKKQCQDDSKGKRKESRMEVEEAYVEVANDNLGGDVTPELRSLRSSLSVLLQRIADESKSYTELPPIQEVSDDVCDAKTSGADDRPSTNTAGARFQPWLTIDGHLYKPLPKQCMYCWRRKPPTKLSHVENLTKETGSPQRSRSTRNVSDISAKISGEKYLEPFKEGPLGSIGHESDLKLAAAQPSQSLSDMWSQEDVMTLTALERAESSALKTSASRTSEKTIIPQSDDSFTESSEMDTDTVAETVSESDSRGLFGKLDTNEYNVKQRKVALPARKTGKVQNIVTSGGIIRNVSRASASTLIDEGSSSDSDKTIANKTATQASRESKSDDAKPGPSVIRPLFKSTGGSRGRRPGTRASVNPRNEPSSSQDLSGRRKPQVEVKPIQQPQVTPDVLQNCPLCQISFDHGSSQMDIDGHIAACLAASSDDVTW